MEHFGPKIGNNLRLYTNVFARGNQYYGIVADVGKIGHAMGPAAFITGVALDTTGYFQGQVSGGKLALNTSMGVIGFFPPEGTALSATYFGVQLVPESSDLGPDLIFQPVLIKRKK